MHLDYGYLYPRQLTIGEQEHRCGGRISRWKQPDHKGFALLDILQPCVSFNDVAMFKWLKQRCERISADHDVTGRFSALLLAEQWDERILVGVFYQNDRLSFEERFSAVSNGPLALQETDKEVLKGIIQSYS